MPINAASRSIQLPDEMAGNHAVLFAVYTSLVGDDPKALEAHLKDHLSFLQPLREQGIVPISGPFFTPDGKNTGNGFYVLKVDSLQEAEQLAAQDPMHQNGIRKALIQPWLQDVS
jgi:uncharacterized protein